MKSPEEAIAAVLYCPADAPKVIEALDAAGYKIVHRRVGADLPETTAMYANYGDVARTREKVARRRA